jgi:hypothetical protein
LVVRGDSIRLHTDYEVAFWAVSSQGSSNSPALTSLVGRIRSVCQSKELTLKIVRIPGSLNIVADSLSRDTISLTEWEVHPLD